MVLSEAATCSPSRFRAPARFTRLDDSLWRNLKSSHISEYEYNNSETKCFRSTSIFPNSVEVNFHLPKFISGSGIATRSVSNVNKCFPIHTRRFLHNHGEIVSGLLTSFLMDLSFSSEYSLHTLSNKWFNICFCIYLHLSVSLYSITFNSLNKHRDMPGSNDLVKPNPEKEMKTMQTLYRSFVAWVVDFQSRWETVSRRETNALILQGQNELGSHLEEMRKIVKSKIYENNKTMWA